MAKRKATRIVHEEKPKHENTFLIVRSTGKVGFVRADHFTIEAEFEGKIALFLDDNEVCVAAIRDWEEIRKIEEEQMEILNTSCLEEVIEKLKKKAKPGDLPPNWGKVNGKDS